MKTINMDLMKTVSKTNKMTVCAGLVLATIVLPFAITAQADQTASGPQKPYPLEKCVVDGKKLAKADKPCIISHEGHEVRLCCEKCLPGFEQHSSKYLRRIQRAEEKAAKPETAAGLNPALDNRPGGLAFAGW